MVLWKHCKNWQTFSKTDQENSYLRVLRTTWEHYLQSICKGRQKRSLQVEISNVTGRVSWFCNSLPEGKSQSVPNWEVNTLVQNLGWPRGMVWGGRREEGSGWGTHVYLWRIHFDIWQNYYNYVKFKNKIKLKKIKK